jgi:hypothetical protein
MHLLWKQVTYVNTYRPDNINGTAPSKAMQ